ncbi:MAG TPA: CPBP family intramembrane glutamic endopeptidase [Polyangia bacterium]|nr:CPBP family intramembrane glutamic endopeptidase [Polyangia bacterium]
MQWLEQPHVKWAVPIPLLVLIAPIVWAFFRTTWRALDEEAFQYRRALHERGEVDYRPLVALTLGALILLMQDYYGRGDAYAELIRPVLARRTKAHPGGFIDVGLYDELYLRGWWAFTRVAGYVLPLVVWPLFFRKDSLLDFGLRPRGFREHAWIYGLCVVVMVPMLLLVSRQGDFASYYPLYHQAGRSWLDFLVWEALYIAQFLTLEIFFRGWWIRATRVFGVGAIWSMIVPYAMIHIGKPYLEACGAMVAGVVLGSLSMRTRSIYAGFLVHVTVAILMDVVSLNHRDALPTLLTPTSSRHITFLHWTALIWIAWGLALAVLAHKMWTIQRARRALVGAAPIK